MRHVAGRVAGRHRQRVVADGQAGQVERLRERAVGVEGDGDLGAAVEVVRQRGDRRAGAVGRAGEQLAVGQGAGAAGW